MRTPTSVSLSGKFYADVFHVHKGNEMNHCVRVTRAKEVEITESSVIYCAKYLRADVCVCVCVCVCYLRNPHSIPYVGETRR